MPGVGTTNHENKRLLTVIFIYPPSTTGVFNIEIKILRPWRTFSHKKIPLHNQGLIAIRTLHKKRKMGKKCNYGNSERFLGILEGKKKMVAPADDPDAIADGHPYHVERFRRGAVHLYPVLNHRQYSNPMVFC